MNNTHKESTNLFRAIIYLPVVLILVLHGLLDILVFKSLESTYKKEVKLIIKAGIQDEDLVLFKFHQNISDSAVPGFQWMKKNEFRYKNEMFDIIKKEQHGDSVYFYCYHDLKESGLFANLDKKIADYLAGNPDKESNIKSIFNQMNKYFNDNPCLDDLNFYPSDFSYSGKLFQATLKGYNSILLPPPKINFNA